MFYEWVNMLFVGMCTQEMHLTEVSLCDCVLCCVTGYGNSRVVFGLGTKVRTESSKSFLFREQKWYSGRFSANYPRLYQQCTDICEVKVDTKSVSRTSACCYSSLPHR